MNYLKAIYESLKLLNPFITLAGFVCSSVLALFNFFNSMWGELLARLAAVTLPPSAASSVMEGFGFIDYVFPLSEMFTFMTAFMTLYVACAGIRIVKSFIPTIS